MTVSEDSTVSNAADVPVACQLSGAAAEQRGREWRLVVSRALISRSAVADGVRIELQRHPGVQEELERLVTAERACCPFVAIDVQATKAALVLTVTAPAAGGAIVEELFVRDER
jgi:hypothetical protein